MSEVDVDFDFFDTPRNKDDTSPKAGIYSRKPPASPSSSPAKNDNKRYKSNDGRDRIEQPSKKEVEKVSDDDSYSDSFSSDTDSETPRYENGNKQSSEKKEKSKHYSDSSSAYSNSDYSSDDSFQKVNYNNNHQKERIEVTVPKVQMNAWSTDFTQDDERSDREENNANKKERNGKQQKRQKRDSSHTRHSGSDSSSDESEIKGKRDRGKSSKHGGHSKDKLRKPLQSTSSSYSNNSDITDVSPLGSPETSPRAVRKHNHEKGQFDNVQYQGDFRNADIKLESDEIDLSILMRCMADIDKEKQQRLKTNTRRVMFAPPTVHDKGNQNYTFSMGRAKVIEKENQRLLKQIMQHVGTAPRLQKSSPKVKKPSEPVIPRLTTSAVNRMREQRRIETENMQMLNRLQRVRATSGMSRKEQLKEFEKQASYGIPTGTLIVGGEGARYDTMPTRDLDSSMSIHRSRPSSAKSNVSVPGGRRSRPSSAKSNASVVSNASMRSNMSMRSNVSRRSNMSTRSNGRSKKGDNRPEWDDRFAYS